MMNSTYRLAVLQSHPIQYFVPLYQRLAQDPAIDLTVYYCSQQGSQEYLDPGFGKRFSWDIPLLEGYRYLFLPNLRRSNQVGGFFSLINPAIIGELRRQSYDSVLVSGYSTANDWLAFLAARLTRTPLFLIGDSILSTPRSLAVRVAKQIILRPLLHSAQVCLYVGVRNREFYENFGVIPEQLVFAPHSVDNDFFCQRAQLAGDEGDLFRQRFRIPADFPVIMSVGKLISKKQPLHLLHAFERLRARQKCALIFTGEGELRRMIERVCVERSIPDVYITGFLNQTEMPAAYAAADILVVASSQETWGLVVNEGMSCGLPIIVTDRVGCAGDLVHHDENGYIVPWNDVNALAEALEKLVVDPDRCKRFGCHSLEIIENYSLERTVNGIVQACLQTGRRSA